MEKRAENYPKSQKQVKGSEKNVGETEAKKKSNKIPIVRFCECFKAEMREMIANIEIARLNPVMHVDVAQSIDRVNYEFLLAGEYISGEEIDYILNLPEQIITLFRSLAYFSKKIVSDTLEGKTPLMYWNNSVAAKNAQN